jgi:hypothetical protein
MTPINHKGVNDMLPISYNKRRRSKTFLSPNSMTPIAPSSHFDYTEYKAELDRRKHFGEPKEREESEKTENE